MTRAEMSDEELIRRLRDVAAKLRIHIEKDDKVIAGALAYLLGAVYALRGAIHFGFDDQVQTRALRVGLGLADALAADHESFDALTTTVESAVGDHLQEDGRRWLAGWYFNGALARIAATADRLAASDSRFRSPRKAGDTLAETLYEVLAALKHDPSGTTSNRRMPNGNPMPSVGAQLAQAVRLATASKYDATALAHDVARIEGEVAALVSLTDGQQDEFSLRLFDAMNRAGAIERGDDWIVRLIYLQVNDLKHQLSGLLSLRAVSLVRAVEAAEHVTDSVMKHGYMGL